MRFLNISGPGVANDEEFCPNCHVLLEQRNGSKLCPLCRYDAHQGGRRQFVPRRMRVRR